MALNLQQLMRTNHKPVITDDGVGIWRRIILIPFGRTFEASQQDSSLEEKLLLERDSILCWMLEGATEYLKNGLYMSPRMRSEVNSYRAESDLLGEFLQDMTELSPESRVLQAGLYSTYQKWCKANGLHPHSKKTFTQRLRARGIHDGKSGNERYYLGIKLSS